MCIQCIKPTWPPFWLIGVARLFIGRRIVRSEVRFGQAGLALCVRLLACNDFGEKTKTALVGQARPALARLISVHSVAIIDRPAGVTRFRLCLVWSVGPANRLMHSGVLCGVVCSAGRVLESLSIGGWWVLRPSHTLSRLAC